MQKLKTLFYLLPLLAWAGCFSTVKAQEAEYSKIPDFILDSEVDDPGCNQDSREYGLDVYLKNFTCEAYAWISDYTNWILHAKIDGAHQSYSGPICALYQRIISALVTPIRLI
jgi:hypothetical protein